MDERYFGTSCRAARNLKENLEEITREIANAPIVTSSFADEVVEMIGPELTTMVYMLPGVDAVLEGIRTMPLILARELEKLTNNIFDGSSLRQLAAIRSHNDPAKPLFVSDIVETLGYATDIITIFISMVGLEANKIHFGTCEIHDALVTDFQRYGGLEKVEALYDGVPLEDIISSGQNNQTATIVEIESL